MTGQTGHVDDANLEKQEKRADSMMKIAGMSFILLASTMSAGIAVLNRSLKDVPYAVVLFYHSFFGIMVTSFFLVCGVVFEDRPLYFLDFSPFDNLILFGATGLDAISVMS